MGTGSMPHEREIEKREGADRWVPPGKEIQIQNINFIQI
jgi:hypothetical protein